MLQKNIPSLLMALALCGFLFLYGCGENSSVAQTEGDESQLRKITEVGVVTVEPTPIQDVLLLPGETKPWQDVTLAADQGGNVEVVNFREGDKVGEGELIAQIEVTALKAALENAEADYRLADEQYKRRIALHNRKIIPAEELDQAKNVRTVAAGRVKQARENYKNAFVYSPVNGRVNKVYADPGEYVGQGAPVVDVVNIDKIKIEVNVPEMDVRYLNVGQQAMVTVDALPDLTTVGTIDFVAFKADPATKTFLVRVIVDNSDGVIRAGMIARVAFLKRTIPDALVAPLFAVLSRGGEMLLFVEEDGVARARTVKIGVIARDKVQITEGLKPGDHLIVTGQTEVEEGAQVKLIDKVDLRNETEADQSAVKETGSIDPAGGVKEAGANN